MPLYDFFQTTQFPRGFLGSPVKQQWLCGWHGSGPPGGARQDLGGGEGLLQTD